MYRLIATDMDGTIFGGDYTISPGNKAAIAAALAIGVVVVPSSGRSVSSMLGFAKELALPEGGFVSSLNGGMVHRLWEETPIRDLRLSRENARVALSLCAGFDVQPIIYTDPYHLLLDRKTIYSDNYIATSKGIPTYAQDIAAALPDGVCKLLLLGGHDELLALNKHVLEGAKTKERGFNTVFSAKNLLEFMPNGASKGEALLYIAELLGIDRSETIAIGDHENDASMIQAAGLGVAMANAEQSLRDIAAYITENDCNNDGVAEVINRFVL